MSNRCPDCSKFVSLEAQEPEVTDDPEINGSSVDFEITLTLNCSECGSPMKENQFSISADAPDGTEEHMIEHPEHEMTIEVEDLSADDEYEARVKPKPSQRRYGSPGSCSLPDTLLQSGWNHPGDLLLRGVRRNRELLGAGSRQFVRRIELR